MKSNNGISLTERAAVVLDTLERLFPRAGMVLRYGNPWELLVAVMLSAQCTDRMVNIVTEKLFRKYQSLDDYVKADASEFEQDIRSTGFYRMKAKHILETARIIRNAYGGTVPDAMEKLVKLPGVARKTANVVLGNAYGRVEGIAVDTHVRRLSRVWGLTVHEDPVKIERDLMTVIPKDRWFKFTYQAIEYGRKYCTGRPHDHTKCPITILLI